MSQGAKNTLQQMMDWRAAVWAGLVSGIAFFLLNILLSAIYLGSPWVYVRIIASTVLGEGVLPPPADFQLLVFFAAFVVHLVISFIGAVLIIMAIYRWGIIVGFVGGGLLGLALYVVNFYALSYFFPWFFPYRSWIMAVSHIVFGALAGGIYEFLEFEDFDFLDGDEEDENV